MPRVRMRSFVCTTVWIAYLVLSPSASVAQSTPPQAAAPKLINTFVLPTGDRFEMSVKGQGVAIVRLVDPKSERVLMEVEGRGVRWYRAAGYVLFRRDENDFALNLTTRQVEGPLSAEELALRQVRDGQARDRIAALRNIQSWRDAKPGEALRGVLVDRLRQTLDTPVSARVPPPFPQDDDARRAQQLQLARTQQDEELDLLVISVGRLRIPETAALIARADVVSAIGALINIGAPAVPVVVKQLNDAAVPDRHRARLLNALHQLTLALPKELRPDADARGVVRRVLAASADARMLKEAVEFADDLDDAESMALVKAFAEDDAFLAKRIPDSTAAEDVRASAARVCRGG